MQVILFLFQKQFQLLHEQSRDNLVFTLFETVHPIERNFLGHLSYYVGVDALHVDLDAADILNIFAYEVQTLLDQPVYLQKLCWN